MFTEPASTRAIADELIITRAAVKQHLTNLYDKFGVPATDSNRRARLANEALRRAPSRWRSCGRARARSRSLLPRHSLRAASKSPPDHPPAATKLP
jgi:predicted ArsR family transcriptional regulator